MTDEEKKKIAALPKLLRDNLTPQQERVVLNYESAVKLKAVVRWKERMVRGGVTLPQLAQAAGKPKSRLSEYMNFKHEPRDESFRIIEKALYNFGY